MIKYCLELSGKVEAGEKIFCGILFMVVAVVMDEDLCSLKFRRKLTQVTKIFSFF